MDFETGGIKKLFKNKFFIVALIVVILMAIYTLTRKSTTRYSGADVDAILSQYPIKDDKISETGTGTIQSETIYSYISDLENTMKETVSDMQESITNGQNDLKNDILSGMVSTGMYFENGMKEAEERDKIYHQSMLDAMNNLGLNLSDTITDSFGQTMDRVDFLHQTVLDKSDALQNQNSLFYDRLHDTVTGGFNNIQWGLDDTKNSINNSIKDSTGRLDSSLKDSANSILVGQKNTYDNLKQQLDSNRKQENMEHSILSESINTWGERLRGN